MPGRRSILVLDDDADIRNVIAAILTVSGYAVKTAGDGEAGWDALCVDEFQVVITNHDMPRLSGLALVGRLRAHQRRVPVILMSANTPWREAHLQEVLSPGTILAKPFSRFELLAAVRNVTTRDTDAQVAEGHQTQLKFDQR